MKTKKKSPSVRILLAEYSECGETIRQFTNFLIVALFFIVGNTAVWQTVEYPWYIFTIVSLVVLYLIPYIGFNIKKAQDRAVAIEKKLRHRGYYTITNEEIFSFFGKLITFYKNSLYVLTFSFFFFLFVWIRVLSATLAFSITLGTVALMTVAWVKIRYRSRSSKSKK